MKGDTEKGSTEKGGSEEAWNAAPSPCVGVCKYRGPKDRCIACAMTRGDKGRFKLIVRAGGGGTIRRRFIVRTVRRLARQGGLMAWIRAYRAKCIKQGAGDVLNDL